MAFSNSDNRNSSSMFGFFNNSNNSREVLVAYHFDADVSGNRLSLADAVDLQCVKLGCRSSAVSRNTRGA